MPLAFVLDDDDDDRAASVRAAIACGFVVEDFDDATGMIGRLLRDPVPDLLLVDLVLPSSNGLDVRRALLADERTATVRVVVVTGTPDIAKTAPRVFQGIPVLGKPVDARSLRAVL